VDGVKREAIVFMPTKPDPSGKSPVIFGFHGHAGNMNAATGMGYQKAWPEAIVIYPQGLLTKTMIDPQGTKTGWETAPGADGDRDIKFVQAMLASLRTSTPPMDPSRVYATGFSNGGIFAYLLWSQQPNLFAAFGVVAGRWMPGIAPTVPKPLIHIGGTNDQTVKFEFQKEAVESSRKVDGATGNGTSCGPICTSYPSTKGAPVVFIVHSGGHVFPPFAGPRIVAFLKQHNEGSLSAAK
jgi:polyhydroxybutyrate depolymerase